MSFNLEVIIKKTVKKSDLNPLLFIHGAWHGAWCWHNFLDYFPEKGFDCYAPSLCGHGKSDNNKSLKTTRLDDYVENVRSVVDSIFSETGKKPVIIGHSMGGLIAQKYLETDHEIPKAFLLAPVPRHGVWQTTLRMTGRLPLAFIKVNLTWSLWPLVSTKERTQKAFFSENIPDNKLNEYFLQMQDESYLGFWDMLIFRLPSPKKVKTPVLVLGAENDTIFSVKEIKSTAKAYGTEAVIFDNMAHDMMLEENWKDVANYIIKTI
ncbi:MAG: alpha/beta hydrolase [Desulfobacteraceae bacterium]|nr:alpha/beta hydrolase [Desulfobacteraceae bacterium]MBC2755257.1 alpha/beta hydrolase [Desulfobacteraceae bacterium]